jgi:two-component system, OmpR family, response regulator
MRIFVVEDNEKLARSIRKGLELEGYAVEVCGDGIDAAERIDGTPGGFAAVVLDRMLPGMDGGAVCRHVRELGNRVPILFLTARDSVEDRVSGLDAGADDYLTKPFSFEELSARIRALLRRPSDAVRVVLRAGGVALDPARREVTAGDRPVSLTAKEFGLLELLLRHPGQVLSRDQIARHVWSEDFEADSNVLEVHVRNIRRKLSEAGNDELIETVRGAGYRLRA